ncbi:MAG: lipopolysaccharide assembly protein LapB [Porticoccus sp.]|nr:lipopolysaccharide assembly protein LapB [Porticoccus sp.]
MPENLAFCLLLLLVVLAWVIGRAHGLRQAQKKSNGDLSKHYFQGVNHLLNEQPDQAIDIFIRSVEVTPQTLETHLALGNSMRQKGEVDRAIRVHQNLLSRPGLNQHHIRQAHLELARDFLNAGLLDRAERLFLELVDDASGAFRQQSLRHLVQIYRDEQEWDKAIRAASMMERKLFRGGENLAVEQAHFCCELAEQALNRGNHLDVRRHLKSALKFNKNSARANALWGDQEVAALNFYKALKRYRCIPQQQSDYLPEVIERVRLCYESLGDNEGLFKQFKSWLKEYPGSSILKAFVEVLRKKEGDDQAAHFLAEYLKKFPSLKGVNVLLDIHMRSIEGVTKDDLSLLKGILNTISISQPNYRCKKCGFKGTQLHWLCPQCRCWETVKPIRNVIGE